MKSPQREQAISKPELPHSIQGHVQDKTEKNLLNTSNCNRSFYYLKNRPKNSAADENFHHEFDQFSSSSEEDRNDVCKRQKIKNKLKLKNHEMEQQKASKNIQKLNQGTKDSIKSNSLGESASSKDILTKNNLKKQLKEKQVTSIYQKNKQLYNYDKESDNSSIEKYQFPFTNYYIEKHSLQFLSTQEAIQKAKNQLRDPKAPGTFLNCDVRYFNWELFIQEVGKFDILIIDPPWRIKGAQQNDSQFMFSNCKFSLQYNTMGNSQIERIPINIISDEGFIFLWILNSQLDSSIEIIQAWGYELIDQITWVKLRDNKIYLTHGYYFMHSYQVCLVGYKNKKQNQNGNLDKKLKIQGGMMNNTMFAEVRKKSQKPDDLYYIIQMMFPAKRSIQIFARNNNLRFGLFSIGNELGESYQKWNLNLHCDKCGHLIEFGTRRYKSKQVPNYDLCFKCIDRSDLASFFQISNQVDEDIRHEYVKCNQCQAQPIWGIRFQCLTCHDFDLCQNCYDKNLILEQKFHPNDHQYRLLQVPVFGNGFAIHEVKCFSCYQNPIIGIYFNCTYCKNYKLCQKCYFQRPKTYSNSRNHKPNHQMQVIFDPQVNQYKRHDCFACKTQITQNCYMCENCFNFFFCQKCFQKKHTFKSLYANNHKKYHIYTKIF